APSGRQWARAPPGSSPGGLGGRRAGSFVGSIPQRQHGANPLGLGLRVDPRAEDDITDGEASMPEDDALVRALASPPRAVHDLADLCVHVLAPQRAARDERMELAAELTLRPVVHHELAYAKRQCGIDGHDPAIGDEERAGREPRVVHEHLGTLESRRLHHDVGATHRLLRALYGTSIEAKVLAHLRSEPLAALPPLAHDAH